MRKTDFTKDHTKIAKSFSISLHVLLKIRLSKMPSRLESTNSSMETLSGSWEDFRRFFGKKVSSKLRKPELLSSLLNAYHILKMQSVLYVA